MPRTPTSADGPKNVTVSVRVTPKMRFGLEMMSRLHHRPIPELVVNAIQEVFSSEIEGLWDDKGPREGGGRRSLLNVLWAERASDRVANIAFECPQLLSGPERRLWGVVKADERFWTEKGVRRASTLLRDELAANWNNIGGESAAPTHFPGQRRVRPTS